MERPRGNQRAPGARGHHTQAADFARPIATSATSAAPLTGYQVRRNRNLALLPGLAPLRHLELWAIRGLEDISPIAGQESLQYLFHQDLSRVEQLPDLSGMTSLRRVHLQNMKRLTGVTPLCAAPALEEFVVFGMRRLQPKQFECLADHPTLRKAVVDIGSVKKNDAIRGIFDLPRPGEFEFH